MVSELLLELLLLYSRPFAFRLVIPQEVGGEAKYKISVINRHVLRNYCTAPHISPSHPLWYTNWPKYCDRRNKRHCSEIIVTTYWFGSVQNFCSVDSFIVTNSDVRPEGAAKVRDALMCVTSVTT